MSSDLRKLGLAAVSGPVPDLRRSLSAGAREWLEQRTKVTKFAIVNPDLDGLLSFCLLKEVNPQLQIGGFYRNESQMLVADAAVEAFRQEKGSGFPSFLSVENDLSIMDSIGQHFCLVDTPNVVRLNPNLMRFGPAVPGAVSEYTENFRIKYPYSTVFFLWLVLRNEAPVSDEQLIALLYPDGAVLKDFANKYRSNLEAWLFWLGRADLVPRFFALQGSHAVKQIARCLFKAFGSSQFAVSFSLSEDAGRMANVEHVRRVTRFFCELLAIEPLKDLPGEYEAKEWTYTRFCAERQPLVQQRKRIFSDSLEANLVGGARLRSRTPDGAVSLVRVLSEALVTHGEWSVTTNRTWLPIDRGNVRISNKVVSGRSTELDVHVESLGLNNHCDRATPRGCVFGPNGCVEGCSE